jgi:hypothetical protein
MQYSTYHSNWYPQLQDPTLYLQPFGCYPSSSPYRHMDYYPTSEYLSNQWVHSTAASQMESGHVVLSTPEKINLPAPPSPKNTCDPSLEKRRFAPSPAKKLFAPSPKRKLFGPSPVSSPILKNVAFCAPSPVASRLKYHSSREEMKDDSWDMRRTNLRSINASGKVVNNGWDFKEMIRDNNDYKCRGEGLCYISHIFRRSLR